MNAWIEQLWQAVEVAEWGTVDLIGAVADLIELVDCGLVAGLELDGVLARREKKELLRVTGHPKARRKARRKAMDWPFVHRGDDFVDYEEGLGWNPRRFD